MLIALAPGSLYQLALLPTSFGDTRDITIQGELPETDTADAELPDVTPGPTTTAAPAVSPNFEFGLSSSLGNQ